MAVLLNSLPLHQMSYKINMYMKISQKKLIDSTEILSMILVNEMLNECFFGGGGWMASSIFVLLS